MKIRLEHKNIGAAVMQIAEHEQFTAINTLKIDGTAVNNGFLVNTDIAVLCKYASEPNNVGEYPFAFNKEHLDLIKKSRKKHENFYFGLVCVEDTEICCLSGSQFDTLI